MRTRKRVSLLSAGGNIINDKMKTEPGGFMERCGCVDHMFAVRMTVE